ncbi:uncharacterized protein LOC133903425 [Phragmites australis]|uniref:uncharacterized protein LOC133903425 n=1 Tax=Phragmites australis TaxID=29695 RepID=UPI002D774D5D|nr:uncharacterized protein LOC133903425 [Phragmites australis]
MASDAASASAEMEVAWHFLTVLVRLGRPAAASNLAAAAPSYVPPRAIERMCFIPGSPLRLSDGGLVTASETAVAAFLRFVGWDVPAPRVSLRPSEVPIRYELKRKGSDAGCFGAKRRRLLAPDADLVEHRERQLHLLVAQACAPAATGEVHMEVMRELQDRLPTLSTFIGEPSLEFSTGFTLVPSIAKITMPCLQPKIDQSLRGNGGSVLGNMALALVPRQLSDSPCCIDLPSPDAEKSKNIHTSLDDKISRIGESEQVSSHNCRVEDSDDLEKESVLLPTIIHAVLVGEKKNGVEEDLNLICKKPGSPINSNMKAVGNIETVDMIPNGADALQYSGPNAGYHGTVPTYGQENNPLGASACAEVHKNEATHNLFQPPTDTRAGSIVPQMNRNVEPAALPLEATKYDCINKRKLNIIAENRESSYLNLGEQIRNEVAVNISKNGQDRRVVKQKGKSKKNGPPKEDKDQLAAKAQKGHVVTKPLPSFKDFVIEEEEGSGGYGTVYRARRKIDGQVFAIKCPHPNAHSHHVYNELKMLERFGGKNFVIKYECSFRSGDLECFVLEHVEHDRPEILKKEIGMLELQSYGYCMFRALASLHKQGIVHRDVKPGNFLFSRKLMKGYLIDFNLANDLHQKFLKNCKSETISCGKDTVSQTSSTFAPVVHAEEAAADSKQPLPSKRKRSNRSPVGGTPKIDNKNRHGSQAADVSGVTSAKDPTSTKTSLDRLKQPMPYKGRKELMNFLHEAMQSPNKNTLPAPVSQRKRVAAPFGSVDRKLFTLTPMPLRSGGSAVAGSGMFNNKGHGKHRREGPCVGTKGFRAPEVLFRSFHQGCKVDVWSAGVTLLYLIIGRTPFGGDPEQNIKEIAKLRGSEELWEVAKLHNCESSYPSDLLDIKLLHSVDLREWCAANTRRPEFLKMIPDSLFDLVDKCLAVNPRCRLTSEDALMHEFFSPYRESLRKRRMLRRSAVSDAACSSHQNTGSL